MLTIGLDTDDQQFSQEFRATSTGNDRLKWIAGVFLFDRSWLTTSTLGFGPAYLGFGRSTSVRARSDIHTFNAAGYGSAEYFLTPELSAEVGLRYSFERKKLNYQQTVGLPLPQFLPVPLLRRSIDGDDFAPSAGLTYRWSPDFRTYVRVARGFKGGGFNAGPSSNPASIEFQPEYMNTYEVGFKSELFDHRLQLNAAAFYLEYKDIQQSQQSSAGFFITNGASARSYGGEVSAVLRAADDLLLTANAGYTDAKYREFGLLSGNRLPRAPRWTAHAGADWTFLRAGWGQAYLRPDVSFRSRSFFDNENTALLAQERHVVLDLRVGIDSSSNWSAGIWGRNLTDRRYSVGSFSLLPFAYYVTPAAPRTFGVDFSVRF
jgi:iron complex outermembrane receptor protein